MTESVVNKEDDAQQMACKKVDATTRLIMLTAANSMLAQYRNDNTSTQANKRFLTPCDDSKHQKMTENLKWSTVYSNSNVKSGIIYKIKLYNCISLL